MSYGLNVEMHKQVSENFFPYIETISFLIIVSYYHSYSRAGNEEGVFITKNTCIYIYVPSIFTNQILNVKLPPPAQRIPDFYRASDEGGRGV